MAKVNKSKSKSDSRGQTPLTTPYRVKKSTKSHPSKKNLVKSSEEINFEGIACSVCLEFPHNAVLLLCASYNKGCRPYMCATSRRFSNCLAQFKKSHTKTKEGAPQSATSAKEKSEVAELLCPLCRGQVKGWTIVEAARKHFNSKRRTCMQEKCVFAGTYKQLKRHVSEKHPLARPRAVDPALEEKWKRFEHERERSDVISTIMSSTPGALVLGDYVVEPGNRDVFDDFDYDSDDSIGGGFYPFESFNRRNFGGLIMPRRRRFGRFGGYRSRSFR